MKTLILVTSLNVVDLSIQAKKSNLACNCKLSYKSNFPVLEVNTNFLQAENYTKYAAMSYPVKKEHFRHIFSIADLFDVVAISFTSKEDLTIIDQALSDSVLFMENSKFELQLLILDESNSEIITYLSASDIAEFYPHLPYFCDLSKI